MDLLSRYSNKRCKNNNIHFHIINYMVDHDLSYINSYHHYISVSYSATYAEMIRMFEYFDSFLDIVPEFKSSRTVNANSRYVVSLRYWYKTNMIYLDSVDYERGSCYSRESGGESLVNALKELDEFIGDMNSDKFIINTEIEKRGYDIIAECARILNIDENDMLKIVNANKLTYRYIRAEYGLRNQRYSLSKYVGIILHTSIFRATNDMSQLSNDDIHRIEKIYGIKVERKIRGILEW